MSFNSSFQKLPRLVQMLLLLIPGVNWITEIVVRASAAMHGKAMLQIIVLILTIPFGAIIGWIDFFSCLIQKKLILT